MQHLRVKLGLLKCCFLGSLLCHALGFVAFQHLTRQAASQKRSGAIEIPVVTILLTSPADFPEVGSTEQPGARFVPAPVSPDLAEEKLVEPRGPQEFGDFINPLNSSAQAQVLTLAEDGGGAIAKAQTKNPVTNSSTQSTSQPDGNPTAVSYETLVGGTRVGATLRPDYWKNPKPKYPLSARHHHEEGIVWLRVQVTSRGRPAKIELKQSSGFRALDDAAMRAVREWEFSPARIGLQSVESEIEVPVCFKLEN